MYTILKKKLIKQSRAEERKIIYKVDNFLLKNTAYEWRTKCVRGDQWPESCRKKKKRDIQGFKLIIPCFFPQLRQVCLRTIVVFPNDPQALLSLENHSLFQPIYHNTIKPL